MAKMYDENVRVEVQRLYESDPMPVSDITEKTGVPERTVYRWAMKSDWRRFYSTPEAARQRSEIAARAKYRAREAQDKRAALAMALAERSSAKIDQALDLISGKEMVENPNLFRAVSGVYKIATDQLIPLEVDQNDLDSSNSSSVAFSQVYQELIEKFG